MDPTQRFSSRVENYIKYRPRYPPAVIETLTAECQLTPAARIADIGSGTGILTELFLQNGNHVFAVEPNREMREAGERLLQPYPNFQSVDGRAEATTLAERSVDFVTAGQAFHWFDLEPTRAEFQRILKPKGWVVLIWNERDTTSTPFLRAYEQLLEDYATDYAQVNHKNVDEKMLEDFYGTSAFKLKKFNNQQAFDYEGLKGRLLSSSYTPEVGHPQHALLLAELHKIFQAHQVNGRVAFDYKTLMYYGRLK
jgi:ubiquinone/menaquinone biosynthesis C-methylase UbiE